MKSIEVTHEWEHDENESIHLVRSIAFETVIDKNYVSSSTSHALCVMVERRVPQLQVRSKSSCWAIDSKTSARVGEYVIMIPFALCAATSKGTSWIFSVYRLSSLITNKKLPRHWIPSFSCRTTVSANFKATCGRLSRIPYRWVGFVQFSNALCTMFEEIQAVRMTGYSCRSTTSASKRHTKEASTLQAAIDLQKARCTQQWAIQWLHSTAHHRLCQWNNGNPHRENVIQLFSSAFLEIRVHSVKCQRIFLLTLVARLRNAIRNNLLAHTKFLAKKTHS